MFTKESKDYKLEIVLYGLNISPKNWNKRFSEDILKLRFENDLHEPCLLTSRKAGKMAVILFYVDDMLIASNSKEKLEKIKNCLGKAFEMKDLGEPKSFLGIYIERNKEEKSLLIHQTHYVENILERFKMKDCKPQSTPMVTRQVNNRSKKRKIEDSEIKSDLQKKLREYPIKKPLEIQCICQTPLVLTLRLL